jgi:hypothetical protein
MLLAATLDSPDGQCVTAEIGCGDVIVGELTAAHCNTYAFDATANQLVTATVRSLSSTFTDTTITLVPPPGDASQTPMAAGGAGATVRYRLPSAGLWSIVVGSSDPASSGAYAVDLKCTTQNAVSDCARQKIVCGQEYSGNLTPNGCRFITLRERLYQLHAIYGVAGDVISIELDSADFAPQINFYDAGLGAPLVRAAASEPGKARLTYTVAATGMYEVGVTSSENDNVGRYALRVNCATFACLDPLILEQPEVVEVLYGEQATLAVDVHQVGPVQYFWYEFVDFPRLVATTTVPQWQTGSITGDRFYYVSARSPCGSDDSDLITVSAKTNRRRAARH